MRIGTYAGVGSFTGRHDFDRGGVPHSSYVPHANRSLRSLNMHLNMRRAPRSMFSFLPLSFKSSSSSTPPTTIGRSASPKGKLGSSTPQVIPPIPPTSNPRGELIFSSRVDRSFKEGYERYRSAFEKRREEKMKEQRRARGWFGWFKEKNAQRTGGRSVEPRQTGSRTPPTSLSRSTGATVASRSRSISPALNPSSRLGPQRQAGGNSPSRSRSHRNTSSREDDDERRSRSRAESYSFILGSSGGSASLEEDLRRRGTVEGDSDGRGQESARRIDLERIAEHAA
jgi:hypothetical protein